MKKNAADNWGILLATAVLRKRYKKSEILSLIDNNIILRTGPGLTSIMAQHYEKVGNASNEEKLNFCSVFFDEIEMKFRSLCQRSLENLPITTGLDHSITYKEVCEMIASL